MAGRKAGSPNRSAFIRDQLAAKQSVSVAEVDAAWKKAGHKGAISPTLFYQVKHKAGGAKLGGRKRGRPPGSGKNTPSAPNGTFHEIERFLDQLIQKAHAMGDASLAESLRSARRQVSARLV